MNEIFRNPGRAEVRKVELQISGSQGRADVQKWNFTSLEVLADLNAEVDLPMFGSPGRTGA